MNRKKVLITIDSFHDGGAEMFAVRLANGLVDSCEVHFMEFNSYVSKIKAQKELLVPKIIHFAPEQNLFLKLLVWLRYKINKRENLKIDLFLNEVRGFFINRYIKNNKIKVLNSHAILQNDTLIGLKRRNPALFLVLTLHGHYEYHALNHPETFEEYIKNHAQNFDKVVYTTEQQKQNFLKFGLLPTKAELIFYGFAPVQILKKLEIKPAVFNIILHSRAIEEKGWIQAIEAVILLNEKGHDVSLTLIGNGQLVIDLWEKYQLPFIEVLGFKSDVFPYIERASLGLLPTYFSGESLPNSVIECLYFGKPVISTTIGAIPQMLTTKEGIAGELIVTQKGYPVGVVELSKFIERYIVDKNYLDTKMKLAKVAFEKFSMTNCIKAYKSVFFK